MTDTTNMNDLPQGPSDTSVPLTSTQAPDAAAPTTPNGDSSATPNPTTDTSQPANKPDMQTAMASAANQPVDPKTKLPQQASPQTGPTTPAPGATPVPPAVEHASTLHQVATAMTGGPRFKTTIDPLTGTTKRTQIPISNRDLGLAIALTAISGGLSGLQARGPNHISQAAGMGYTSGVDQVNQAQQKDKAQAQQQFENQSKATAQRLTNLELNSRIALNTAEAEKYGQDGIQKLIDNEAPALEALDDSAFDGDRSTKVTQQQLQDGIKAGKYNAMDQLGPVNGMAEYKNQNGTKGYEATHAVIRDPKAPYKVSLAKRKELATAGDPNFRPVVDGDTKDITVPYFQYAKTQQTLNTRDLAEHRLNDLRGVLKGTEFADKVPAKIDYNAPGIGQGITVGDALAKFQRWTARSNEHGMDIYDSLKAMGTKSKPNPKTGVDIPNPDGKYADTVAEALGGWNVLEAAHDQEAANKDAAKLKTEKAIKENITAIHNDQDAEAVLANKNKYSPDLIKSAQTFMNLDTAHAGSKAYAEASAKDKVDEENQARQQQFLKSPDNFKVDPTIREKTLPDAEAALKAQGVAIPENFAALYAISKNRANLTTLPQKTYKGTPNVMTSQSGLAFIQKFLNPTFNEGDYGAAAALDKEMASTKNGTAGGSLLAAGTAANHVNLLRTAATALHNSDIPSLNHIANQFGIAIGKNPATTFKAINDIVNQEVAKTVGGGPPHEAELAKLHDNLNRDQSDAQINGVTNAYVGLMKGRVSEIDERNRHYFGEGVHLSPATTKLFNDHTASLMPKGKIPFYSSNKLIKGYADDANGTNFVSLEQ